MNELNAPATEFKLPSKRKDEIENYSEICVGDAFVEIGEEDTDKEDLVESFERASADLEIVHAAYPDEIIIEGCNQQRNYGPIANNNYDDDEKGEMDLPTWFPLIFTLTLPLQRDEDKFGATITMELPKGYPVSKSLQVVSYRCAPSIKKDVIEHAVSSVKDAASEALHSFGGEECSLSCCAIAIETWKTLIEAEAENQHQTKTGHGSKDYDVKDLNNNNDDDDIEWITSDKTLIDRKSVFQAHLCKVTSEDMTKRAVNKLIEGSTKIQRATHNMFAYRFTEELPNGKTILKHDNDDDGEDGAGSRLAQLLHMRKEDGLLILVSRWYGGTHLGPKRFAHITNVARDLLVEYHDGDVVF